MALKRARLWAAWLAFSWAATASADPLAADSLVKNATYKVAGLTDQVEIVVDRWGIPHIYARDHYDVFFGQGFNAARDRLWQIDLWRKRGLGRLAATFGPDYVEQDKAARLFLYRGDMYSEWLAYGNDAKRITESFVAGINAFIELTRLHPVLLPPEFDLLDYKPERWAAEDVVRIRSNGLWRNVNEEVWRARLACEDNLQAAARWRQLQPAWRTAVPAGLDPCDIPADVLRLYHLAKAPVSFAALHPDLASAAYPADSPFAPQDDVALASSLGSNNWAVAPERTTTGRPILADDPHRGHATPSLRYIAHLIAPGIDVIGAGEPALPGISIGHNERIAFGLTIFPIDQEDLYVYRRHKQGYRYADRTDAIIEHVEQIEVKGQPPVEVTLRFTRHGPIVAESKTQLFAVRAAWLEPGMSPYFGSIEYMRAGNYREFSAALNRWGAPSENQVYADIDGNIGYKPAGRFPRRQNWDGLMPVPGDGRYEWDGYFDMDALPEEYNPERGFTGTANSMNLPPDYPINERRVGFEWSAPWRYKRLWEVLEQDDAHTLDASLALQRDYVSVFARQVLARLPGLAAHPGGELLANWDARMGADSAAGAFWNVYYTRHLNPALGRLVMQSSVPSPALDTLTVLELLETDPGRQAAYAALGPAYRETRSLLGDDPQAWRWGELHQIKFQHPLLNLARGTLQDSMRMPAYPRGGNVNTTNNTGYRSNSFDVAGGASFRIVVDVGNWDRAYGTNAPGQSGDPRSPFYKNLLQNWATDSHFPLLYSKSAIDQARAFTWTLEPRHATE